MKINQLKLSRFNGEELFEIIETDLYFSYEYAHLNLEFRTGKCISPPLEDTNTNGGLSGSFWLYDLEISNVEELEGQSFYIEDGYKNEHYDTCSLFYYWEHEPVSKNTIEFVECNNDFVQVKITAYTCDVNWHDGSKPETKIELLANFDYPENYTEDSSLLF